MDRLAKLACLLLLLGLSHASQATPVDFLLDVRVFNPGPFTAGSPISGSLNLDDSVSPTTIGTITWTDAADDLVLTIVDPNLGTIVITGNNGDYQQVPLSGGPAMVAHFSVADGSLDPLQVSNPALSPDPFSLSSLSFDFRTEGVTTPTDQIVQNLTLSDFGYLDLTIMFSHPTLGIIDEWNINKAHNFDALNVGNGGVPIGPSALLLLLGLFGLAFTRRGHLAQLY